MTEQTKGHPNASILMEIAKEAAVNPDPLNAFYCHSTRESYKDQPLTADDITALIAGGFPFEFFDIRRKPRTIRIGNYDVPEPCEAWTHSAYDNVVCVKFVEIDGADLILKALQELLGAKK